MKVRFKKVDQGGAALSCERIDGSQTWQRPKPSQAAFFALHDLTHFAAESELSHLQGFFGLISEGWDISDFETASTGDSLPTDALIIEFIVGLLDNERASQTIWSADEFNKHITNYCMPRSIDVDYQVNDEQLNQIRRRRNELFMQWRKLKTRESLELSFQDSTAR